MPMNNIVARKILDLHCNAFGGLMKMPFFTDVSGNPSNLLYGSNPFTPTGGINPAYAHSGGVVGALAGGSRYIDAAYFDNAPRMHGGGGIDWAAGERPIVGLTGERVLNRRETADYNGGGSKVEVNIINNASGAKVEKNERQEGGVSIVDVIISTVNEGMANGKFDGTMQARHGLQLRPRMR